MQEVVKEARRLLRRPGGCKGGQDVDEEANLYLYGVQQDICWDELGGPDHLEEVIDGEEAEADFCQDGLHALARVRLGPRGDCPEYVHLGQV